MTDVKKAIKKKNYISAIVHLMAFPIEWLIGKIGILKSKHKTMFSILFGTILLLAGAALGQIEQHWIPKFIWEAGSGGIHGLGLAPILKIVCDAIEIEI